jgi:peptidoglycan L-alanyl-D-glutamate endopeptidase CwlK
MGFSFGKASTERLNTCHPDLRLIAREALQYSQVDFGISEGVRTDDKQLEYFLARKAKLDPRVPEQRAKARHLANEHGLSDAFDFYAFVPGKPSLAFDFNHLCMIAGVLVSTANRLLAEGRIGSRVRWGGNWDGDGEIITDQTFNDLPHLERIP